MTGDNARRAIVLDLHKWILQIERFEKTIKTMIESRNEVYKEIKSAGLTPAIIRGVVKVRAAGPDAPEVLRQELERAAGIKKIIEVLAEFEKDAGHEAVVRQPAPQPKPAPPPAPTKIEQTSSPNPAPPGLGDGEDDALP